MIKPRQISLLFGFCTALLGAVVLFGWFTGNDALTRVHPSFVSMKFNAALGLLLCGTGLMAAACYRHWLAAGLGAVVAGIGTLTILEYLLNLNMGLDELFVQDLSSTGTFHPGRMAPTTAGSFLLNGLALVLSLPSAWQWRYRRLAIPILASIVVGIGLSSLWGYWVGESVLYSWGRTTQMAVHTAFCFSLLGIGTLSLAWSCWLEEESEAPVWVPWSIGLFLLVVSISLWQVLKGQEERAVALGTEQAVAAMSKGIRDGFQTHMLSLERMAQRWSTRGGTPRAEWESDARNYIQHQPGIQALEWVDDNYIVRWVVPLAGNEAAQGMDLSLEKNRLFALENARQHRTLTLTGAIDLVQHGKGLVGIAPIFIEEKFAGFVLEVFKLEPFLNNVLLGTPKGYLLTLSEKGQVIYNSHIANASSGGAERNLVRTAVLNFYGVRWELSLVPTMETVHNQQSAIPTLVLGLCVAISLFSTLLVSFQQSAARSHRKALALTITLQEQAKALVLQQQAAMNLAQEAQAEKIKAQSAESRIQQVLAAAPFGIMMVKQDGRIALVNQKMQSLFGYSREEMLGQPVEMLMPERFRERHPGHRNGFFEDPTSIAMGARDHLFAQRRDGTEFPVEIGLNRMTTADGVHVLAAIADISERKKVERMKSEFVSTVSHELRTPLTSILGALGIAVSMGAEYLPEKALRMLELAERNSKRLAMLINDLLDLEKLDAGHLEFSFQILDLVTLTQRAMEDNEGYAGKHQVRLVLDVQVPAARVNADEHRLLQVLANLISNAVKFSPAKGEVSLSVGVHAGGYRVAVRDQGGGISEEFRDRMFQRFSQADSSDSRAKGGTGLGLNIAKAIIDRHDGKISYESKVGEGTVFYIDLPAAVSQLA